MSSCAKRSNLLTPCSDAMYLISSYILMSLSLASSAIRARTVAKSILCFQRIVSMKATSDAVKPTPVELKAYNVFIHASDRSSKFMFLLKRGTLDVRLTLIQLRSSSLSRRQARATLPWDGVSWREKVLPSLSLPSGL